MTTVSTYKGQCGYNIINNMLEQTMSRIKDITGVVSGKLKATSFSHKEGRHAMWLCECECGNKEHIVRGSKITAGDVKSCGCIAKENQHGMARTRTYKVWENMITRVTNPKHKSFKDYGERGITVCEEWRDFRNFFADIGELKEGIDIDRIDNDKGYYKENIRIVDRSANLENTRRSKWWYIDGVKYESSTKASEALGIDVSVINRMCNGYTHPHSKNWIPAKDNCWCELKYGSTK